MSLLKKLLGLPIRPKNRGNGILFQNYRAGDLLLLDGVSASDKLDEIEIRNCSLRLEGDEQCFYQGIGYAYKSREEVTGYKHTNRGTAFHRGSSFRLSKSFSVGRGATNYSSSGTSQAIKQTVTSHYEGTLFITSCRIVFLCDNDRFSFDASLDDIQDVTMYDDEVVVFEGTKTHHILSDDCIFIRDLIVLMNMCYEDQQAEETGFDSLSGIDFLWMYGDEDSWDDALEHYYELIPDKNMPLENELAAIRPEQVESMTAEEFYYFLHDKYFVWKYTQKNRLATTRMHLEKYITEDRLHELKAIKEDLFSAALDDAEECLSIVSKIRGLGPAGASGLLAILFPHYFGTVDQFVVKALLKVEKLRERNIVERMKPESLTISDASVLVGILRKQARYLNTHFQTDDWTPRKIDMVLWAIER